MQPKTKKSLPSILIPCFIDLPDPFAVAEVI